MVHLLTKKYPLNKNYSLKDQIMRAASSITANIAESYGRKTKKDKAQFITYSLGSCNEVVAFLDIIKEIYPKLDIKQERNFYLSLSRQILANRNKIPKS